MQRTFATGIFGVMVAVVWLVPSVLIARQDTKTGEQKSNQSEPPADQVNLTDFAKQYWRIGARLRGGSGTCKNLLVTIPMPVDWPEQSVKVIQKTLPAEVKSFQVRDTSPILKQMVAVIPTLRADQVLEFGFDVEVTLRRIAAPADTSPFAIPKSVPRDLRDFLDVSPQISFKDSKLRGIVKEVTAPGTTAWEQVKAISQWIQANIEPRSGDPIDTVECFRERKGTPEDITCLFVAMCRAHKVPARMVWIDGSQRAEFYLVDPKGNGSWFPASLGGFPEFGQVSIPRLIEMKGDSFKVPEKEAVQKYVFEFVAGEGAAKPKVEFIREQIPNPTKKESPK